MSRWKKPGKTQNQRQRRRSLLCRKQQRKNAVTPDQTQPEVEPKLIEFLEADSFDEKYNILTSMRGCYYRQYDRYDGGCDGYGDSGGDLDKRYDDLRYVIPDNNSMNLPTGCVD